MKIKEKDLSYHLGLPPSHFIAEETEAQKDWHLTQEQVGFFLLIYFPDCYSTRIVCFAVNFKYNHTKDGNLYDYI